MAPSESTITISKKRAGWLVATIIVMCGFSSWSMFYPQGKSLKVLSEDKLERVTNQQFVSETIDVDGKDFEHCTFLNVRLRLQGKSSFKLAYSKFLGSITLTFGTNSVEQGAAMATIILNEAHMVTNGSIGLVNQNEKGEDVFIFLPSPSPNNPSSPTPGVQQ